MATLVATAGMAVAIGAILRAGRVASPRLGGVIMALLGPAWLGSFAITSVYLGYQQQAANTPGSEQEASHSLDWTQPVWAGLVVVFLVVSVIRTARAGRGINAEKLVPDTDFSSE